MAVEQKRGCGYRKVGGTYMMSGKLFKSCDRLPFELTVCPCCGEGYRPSRTLRAINPQKMLGIHQDCKCSKKCLICHPEKLSTDCTHYLEWIGTGFYKDPADFVKEAQSLGISRRLKSGIPRGLVVGETVVYLAHRDVLIEKTIILKSRSRWKLDQCPAIFSAFIVDKLEHICTESEQQALKNLQKEIYPEDTFSLRIKQLDNLIKKGVLLISVPDDDQDHI